MKKKHHGGVHWCALWVFRPILHANGHRVPGFPPKREFRLAKYFVRKILQNISHAKYFACEKFCKLIAS